VKVLISRISKIDGDWVVHDAITFDDTDAAYAHAVQSARAWRAEDPERRRYVIDELPSAAGPSSLRDGYVLRGP
jgi:hypothetical protein